jgi:hypothetical protein
MFFLLSDPVCGGQSRQSTDDDVGRECWGWLDVSRVTAMPCCDNVPGWVRGKHRLMEVVSWSQVFFPEILRGTTEMLA